MQEQPKIGFGIRRNGIGGYPGPGGSDGVSQSSHQQGQSCHEGYPGPGGYHKGDSGYKTVA